MADPAYQKLLPIAVVLFWSGVVLLLHRVKGGKHKSISQHAATSVKTSWAFGLVLVVAVALQLAFVQKWLAPTLGLGWLFYLCLYGSAAMFTSGAAITDTKGLQHAIHRQLARVGSLLIMPVVLLIAASNQVSGLIRIIDLALLATMFVLWFRIDVMRRSLDKFLVYQISYFACFHATLLITTYVR